MPRRRQGRAGRRKQMPLWQELPLLLIVAFCLAVLIRTFLVQAFFIPSGSMENTLLIGDRVLVNKVVYDMRDPLRGEIVVFRGTDNWAPEVPAEPNLGFAAKLGRTVGDLVGVSRPGEKDFIKRVIGLPGDKVSCCDDQGRVHGQRRAARRAVRARELRRWTRRPTRSECRSRRFAEVTVRAGQMFVMGDHRLVSQDARCQGPVPIDNVIGRAFVIVWPNEQLGSRCLRRADVRRRAGARSRPGRRGTASRARGQPTGVFGIVMPFLLGFGLIPRVPGRNVRCPTT